MESNQAHPLHHAVTIMRSFLDTTVIADMQKNRIRLTGLPPLVQLLGGIILGLLGCTTVLMIFAGNLRDAFQTIVITTDSHPNGLLLPSTAIGLVLFLLCMAWTFLLVAIQHAAWWIRVPGVCIHLFMMSLWVISLAQSNLQLFGAVIVVMGVQTIIGLRRPRGNLVRNWVLIALCESIILAVPHSVYLHEYHMSGIGLLFTSVGNFIQSQFVFITPMLFLVGISMAQTALNIADWGTHTAQRMPAKTVVGMVIVCIVWRLFLIDERTFPDSHTIINVLLYTGGFIAIVTAIYVALPQPSPTSSDINDLLERSGPWMIIAYLAPLIVNIVVINIFGLVAMAAVVLGYDRSALLDTVSQVIPQKHTEIQLMVAGFVAIYAILLWRRGSYFRGAFFAITTYHLAWRAVEVYFDTSISITLIEHLFFGGSLIITVARYLRGTLTRLHLHGFLFVTICSALLLNADFLNNPLSPFLGFAGIIFIAIGVIWDVLFGSSWVNNDSAQYPRVVRLFFYLGYCLLMTIVAFWAVLSQDTWMTKLLTGESALLSMHTFATPILHLLYCFMIFWPASPHAATPEPPLNHARRI